jgi:peptidoglycan/xylan/chitin deacetylase (PgdA/CDA1 family)
MWRVAAFALRPRPRGASVLLYHNVDDALSPYVRRLGITMSTAEFEAHLGFLAKTRTIVPFSRLDEHRGDPRAIALTFDDGYKSIRNVALPILERLGIPFKAYVLATPHPGEANWLNQLSYLLDTRSTAEMAALAEAALGMAVPVNRLTDVTPFVEHFVEVQTPTAIREVFRRHHPDPVPDLYLDDEDIRALAAHPLVELGSHTRNHYPLHRVSHETLEAEVELAHAELIERYGDAIDGFCPPFGYRHHLTEAVVKAVNRIDNAVVTAYGGRTGVHEVHGVPEIRRIGAWGNLGVLWHQLRYEP